MWAMVKAANEADSERLKNITTRLIANLMCDYKLVHLVVDNLGVKVRPSVWLVAHVVGGAAVAVVRLNLPLPLPRSFCFLSLPLPPVLVRSP
jgi:hypothetical protein